MPRLRIKRLRASPGVRESTHGCVVIVAQFVTHRSKWAAQADAPQLVSGRCPTFAAGPTCTL